MTSKTFPRFRACHRTVGGRVVTYYFWDGRGRGITDVPLGTDREKAIEGWRKCEEGIFPVKPTKATKEARARRLSALPKLLPLPRGPGGKRRNLAALDWSTYPSWLRTLFFGAEQRAISSGKAFSIGPRDLLAVAERADGRCEVSGIEFQIGGRRSPFAPSLDRIDSSKGYAVGNIRLVCFIVNVAMNNWGEGPLLLLAERLCKNVSATRSGNAIKSAASSLALTEPQQAAP